MKKILPFIALLWANILFGQQELRVYHIGNSVTDAINYSGLKALAESRGNTHVYGRHIIPGSPLELLWQNRDGGPEGTSGFTENSSGYPSNAFAVYNWDALTLQPFDRGLEGDNGDKTMVNNYINLIKDKSPDAKICIYSRWPRKPGNFNNQASQWNDLWNNCSGQTNECRSFFETLTSATRALHPTRNIVMIPVGEVFYELNKIMEAGGLPGFNSIWDVYPDGIHLNGMGAYIAACTFYTVLYGDDPSGLTVPGVYGSIPPLVVSTIHQVIKDVVIANSLWTKIDFFGPAPVKSISFNLEFLELNMGESALLTPLFFPTNAANKNLTWESGNTSVALVNDGVITPVSIGTTVISATSEDGGKIATCTVTITDEGVAVEKIELSKSNLSLLKDSAEIIEYNILPSNATNQSVIWSSSDTTVVSVNDSGSILARKKGFASIIATSVNGGKSDTCTVEVTIVNNVPVAVLKLSPKSGYAPLKVIFDGTSSNDPDPDDFVLGYDWEISDGTTKNSNKFEHTFTQPGKYWVTLVPMDSHGLRGEMVSDTLVVLQLPQVPEDEPALCYEGFDYVNTTLHNLNGGRGWAEGWSVQNSDMGTPGFEIANSSPLVYKNLVTSIPYHVGGRAYLQAARRFDLTDQGAFADYLVTSPSRTIGKSGTTLWFSCLVSKLKNNNDGAWISLFSGQAGSAGNGKIQVGYFGTSGTRYWELKVDNTVYSSGVPLEIGKTALLVVKIEFGTSNKISLHVNPDQPGSDVAGTPSVIAETSNTVSFSSIGLYPTNGSAGAAIDEIRFGNDFPSVTPVFQVNKQDQVIHFPEIGDKTIEEVVELTASATSGLPVSFTIISGPATLINNQLAFQQPGEVIIEAIQPGNEEWNAATPVQRVIQVSNLVELKVPGSLAPVVYPNPFRDELSILINPTEFEDFVFTIVEISGRVMYSAKPVEKLAKIDTSNWPRGVYLLTVDSAGSSTRKIIIK
jgi:PKD repeat protein